jgi:hypothetical protein
MKKKAYIENEDGLFFELTDNSIIGKNGEFKNIRSKEIKQLLIFRNIQSEWYIQKKLSNGARDQLLINGINECAKKLEDLDCLEIRLEHRFVLPYETLRFIYHHSKTPKILRFIYFLTNHTIKYINNQGNWFQFSSKEIRNYDFLFWFNKLRYEQMLRVLVNDKFNSEMEGIALNLIPKKRGKVFCAKCQRILKRSKIRKGNWSFQEAPLVGAGGEILMCKEGHELFRTIEFIS